MPPIKYLICRITTLFVSNSKPLQSLVQFLRVSKVRFKNLCAKFWNRCCYSTIYQIFLIQIAFQSSDRAELDFWDFVIKITFNLKSWGTEKNRTFLPRDLQLLLLLLLITNINIFKFAMLRIKLWPENDNILYQFWTFDWVNLKEYKGDLYLIRYLLPTIALYLTQQNRKCLHIYNRQYKEFHISNLWSRQSLGRKPRLFSVPWDLTFKDILSTNPKIKLYSGPVHMNPGQWTTPG